ncbi:MAG: FAD-dependent thymidylate synthase [Spirochaetales bacterium]|nr:FAD-dependent thymidylate synthase [Spirochaetales bacterium]MCF7938268.1 FAD-dependent thymidylate synthase [Spirochaetales bacterium]
MAHCIVPEAEQILDKEYPVLDHGFVRLVDYLGGDQRVVQSARVSYGEGTKSVRQDKGLIDYLLRNDHTSPFEQVILTFHAKMPIFVARQWVRHRTARLNEISGRYSVLSAEFYLPDGEVVSLQSTDNKQGRSVEAVGPQLRRDVLSLFEDDQRLLYQHYRRLLDKGLARELSRINLPLSLYTEWYWQIDLHNLFHFLRLRMDRHAQLEIRKYAETIFEITRKVAPFCCESFQNHHLNGIRFSSEEMEAVRRLVRGEPSGLEGKKQERFLEKLYEEDCSGD